MTAGRKVLFWASLALNRLFLYGGVGSKVSLWLSTRLLRTILTATWLVFSATALFSEALAVDIGGGGLARGERAVRKFWPGFRLLTRCEGGLTETEIEGGSSSVVGDCIGKLGYFAGLQTTLRPFQPGPRSLITGVDLKSLLQTAHRLGRVLGDGSLPNQSRLIAGLQLQDLSKNRLGFLALVIPCQTDALF